MSTNRNLEWGYAAGVDQGEGDECCVLADYFFCSHNAFINVCLENGMLSKTVQEHL